MWRAAQAGVGEAELHVNSAPGPQAGGKGYVHGLQSTKADVGDHMVTQ